MVCKELTKTNIDMAISKSKLLAKRRYYLHKMVKRHFMIVGRDRTVYVDSDSIDEAKGNKYISELISEFR